MQTEQIKSQKTAAEAKELIGLLEYQDASIVSRVLLKNKGGTVTLFAFAAGEGLSEHTAPFEALVINIEGKASIGIDGDTFTLEQGETITLPANRPHSVKATTNFKMVLIMIRE